MNQEKITNIVRQVLILIGTALIFFKVDPAVIESGKEIVLQLTGVIFDLIAMVGLIRSKVESELQAVSYTKPSISRGIINALKMK